MTRRLPALLLLAATLAAGCSDPAADGNGSAGLAARLPVDQDLNVIIVSFDALRPDYLGAYGHPVDASPRIDEFARDALVFDRAYTAAQATPTSFASAFTGRYPFRVFLKWKLADVPTLAEAYTAGGYRTGGFFNNRQVDPERNFGRGFETYEVDYNQNETEFLLRALIWMDGVRDERFFLWIHFISPHAPYHNREMSARFYTPGYTGRFAAGSGPPGDLETIDDPDELARFKELYTGEVHYADHLFGKVWDSLAERGLIERSVIVLTADHGEGLMDHGVLFHQQVYEEVVRVPLVIRHPGGRRGSRYGQRVANVDLFPTLTALSGLPVPADVDGYNLLEPVPEPRTLLLTAMTNMDWRSMAVLHGDHKLIANCPRSNLTTWELYDLAADPTEQEDLYEGAPVLADSLRAIIEALTGGGPCGAIRTASRGKSPIEGLSPEKIEQLKSLGYVR